MPNMKVATFQSAEAESLEIVEVERPEPGMIEVLVKVHVAGVNPVDWKLRQAGYLLGRPAPEGPTVLGWDLAGEVVAIGAGVTRFAVGDQVFGMPRFPDAAGCYAEYVACPSRHLARIPAGTGMETAGALPLAGLTAWQCVVDTLQAKQGDKLLIHAAAGGVGHLAVQIAKARGAEVWGTASAAKHDLLRDLGVDHCIDYRSEDFTEVAKGMDAVIDFVGGKEHVARSMKTLRRGGKLIAIPSPDDLPEAAELEAHGVSATWLLVEPDHMGLEGLAAMLEAGTLKVLIAESKPWTELGALHQLSEAGSATGKLVATIG